MTARKGKKIEVNVPGDDGANEAAADETAAASLGAETDDEAGETKSSGSFSPKVSEPWAESGESAEKDSGALEPDSVDMDAEMEALLEEEKAKAAEEEHAKELEAAKQEAREATDRYMRLQAEWDNFRKRTAAERESERIRASEGIVKNILPVIDDFERAIAHADETEDIAAFKSGVEAVHTKLVGVLVKAGVEVIDPEGEAFDANKHQAIGTEEKPDVYDETVTQVLQKGYEMGGHVIRPAMVMVSTGGEPRPVEDEEKEDEQSEDEKEE